MLQNTPGGGSGEFGIGSVEWTVIAIVVIGVLWACLARSDRKRKAGH